MKKVHDYMAQGEENQIPDFQIFFDEASNTPMVFDPGDPEVSGNNWKKHMGWITRWIKDFEIEISNLKLKSK